MDKRTVIFKLLLSVWTCFSFSLYSEVAQENQISQSVQDVLEHFCAKKNGWTEALKKRLEPNQPSPSSSMNSTYQPWFIFSIVDNYENQKAILYYKQAVESFKIIGKIVKELDQEEESSIDIEKLQNALADLIKLGSDDIATAIDMNPLHPGFYIVRGMMNMLIEEYSQAKEDFEISLSLDPEFSDIEQGLLPGDADLLLRICNDILSTIPHI